MTGIDNYMEALKNINDRRMRYLPGNKYGNTNSDFLLNEYKSVYNNHYTQYLLGVIPISRIIASQEDIDYFNILFRGYTRIKLV